ncbi:hypothetical protein ACFOD0_08870 [Shewanella intestini]|uniref:Transporter n=1 Tax=Shewanella intestini TaxID=2017544 RepID=A0ABS5HZ28_9GAMM|nr:MULTISPECIES: hypothetical protein [Shewanella]MBR9726991.1 hypothetical protein [Shewanella intestini]MRG34443.1 hypothetical protein [Shewanella sp. XMDDZSB0408]
MNALLTKAVQLSAALCCCCFAFSTIAAQAKPINTHTQTQTNATTATPDASHYAFANYLGSGVYRTAGQKAAVANIPISMLIDEDDDHQMKLRLPVSLGFFNYSFTDLPEGEFPDTVGTLTITPGLEYHWFYNDKLTLESYLDLGYGHNFTNSSNIGIVSVGTGAIYRIDNPKYTPILSNKLFWAGYRSSVNHNSDSFAVFQSGVDFGLGYHWQWQNVEVEPRLFVSGRWYFDQLTFINPEGEDVLTNHSYEVGASLAFSKPVGWEVFGWDGLKLDRFGISYQNGGGLEVWRLIFDIPI